MRNFFTIMTFIIVKYRNLRKYSKDICDKHVRNLLVYSWETMFYNFRIKEVGVKG